MSNVNDIISLINSQVSVLSGSLTPTATSSVVYTPPSGTISTDGIAPGGVITSDQILRIINALNGVSTDTIIISGSLITTGLNEIDGTLALPFIEDGNYLFVTGGLVTGNTAIASASFATSASYAATSSLPLLGIVGASADATTITFTKGDQTTFDIVIAQSGSVESASYATFAQNAGAASTAISASYALIANYAQNAETASYVLQAESSSYALTASFALNVPTESVSSSYALSASRAISAANADTASFVTLAQTASYVNLAQTASYVVNAISSSFATSASYAVSASYAPGSDTSISASYALSASYAATASSADSFLVRDNITASNALITGTVTAQTLVIQTITSSVIYSSGSNIFGNELTNTQQLTGSVTVTGSLDVNGFRVVDSSQTASMSVLSSSFSSTASFVQNAVSSSFALTASFALNSSTTGSFTGSFTGNLLGTSSYANNADSSSFALTASYVLNGGNSFSISTGSIEASVNIDTASIFLIQSASLPFFNIASNSDTTVYSDLFIIKGFTSQQPVLTVSGSIVNIATHSIDPAGNTAAGNIYFTSTSMYIGLE